jgi:dTDP-4-amino-4,6-dideoxygalactose transaminase/predicted dehydrogenase
MEKAKPFCKPLRVGVVGLGSIAPDHLNSFDHCLGSQVVAVSDVQPVALAAAMDLRPGVAGYLDYSALLQEMRPDILSVCTWPQSHAQIVMDAAKAGVKAILCEKPIALTMPDLRAMIDICFEHGVKLAGGHQYRFHPAFVHAEVLIRSQRLGPVQTVTGCIKSTLANNGPHLIDTVRFLLGNRPAEQIACRCQGESDTFSRGYPAENGAEGEIVFQGGITFFFRTGEAAPDFFKIQIECEKGRLEVTPKSLILNGIAKRLPPDPSATCRSEQFHQFIRWAKNKQHYYLADGESSAASAELVLAAYEAARLGTIVTLPLNNDADVIRQLFADQPQITETNHVPLPSRSGGRLRPCSERLALDGGPRSLTEWFSSHPVIGLRELTSVAQVIASKNLNAVDGRMVSTLEQEFASCYGARAAVASSSGTAAIHVALGTLNPEPLSEIITTPVTDMGSIIPILASNCIPVFADIDPITGNLTAESIAARITPRTAAIILVHLFGRPAELDQIAELALSRGIALIEDCSQAHFAVYEGRKVGTFGDFGCFSFQQSKQMTCGDGGMTLVNRPELIDRAAMFVDKGWDRKHGSRSHLFFGMNYRMTELQAAVARVQLQRLPPLIENRRSMAIELSQKLSEIPGIRLPQDGSAIAPSWWMFLCHVDEATLGVSADAFAGAVRVEGARVKREYVPRPVFEYEVLKHRQTYGRSGYPFTAVNYREPSLEDFPGYLEFSKSLMLMGWSHHVRRKHVEGIARAMKKVATLLPLRTGCRSEEPIRALQEASR